jgi:glycyl-tRNA synthetase (class II)
LRDRDSLAQQRVAIDDLAREIEHRLAAPWHSPKLAGP